MIDPQRSRTVATHFERLQGYRILPGGVLLFAVGAFLLEVGFVPGLLLTLFAGLAASVVAAWAIGRFYYRRRYGSVRQRSDTRHSDLWGSLTFSILFVGAFLFDQQQQPVVSTMLLLPAVGCFVYWWWLGARVELAHYVAGAALLGAAGCVLPSFLGPADFYSDSTSVGLAIACLLFGFCLLSFGLLDHRFLLESLRSAES